MIFMNMNQFLFDFFIFHLILLITALIFDLILGDPPSRFHPVIWIGKLINFLKSKLKSTSSNTPKKDKFKGFLLTFLSLVIFLVPLGIGFWLIKKFLIDFFEIYGIIAYCVVIALFFKSSFAIRCLRDSTLPIAKEIENGNIDKAKSFLNMIVRRDPKDLTEEQVISAAVESIAESSVDGITSPIFYFFIFNVIGCFLGWEWTSLGVLGAVGYRIINTLDSMVGYKTPKYINIGWFSAKSDDIVNYLPERLTTLLMLPAASISGEDSKNALKVLQRDRNSIESMNAGWSMSCMAGALQVQLEKPVKYKLGDPIHKLEAKHIKKSLQILYITIILFLIIMLYISLLIQNVWFKTFLEDTII